MNWLRPVQVSSLILTTFAVVTGAIIAATYLGTKDKIVEQERIAQAKALLEIMPRETHDNIIVDDTISVNDETYLRLRQTEHIYIARKDGAIIGYIIPAIAPDGYSGDIRLVTGVFLDGTIAGVRVLSHNETPGLGDKVDYKKSQWIDGFIGKSLLMPSIDRWKVKKDKGDFDQFTGATITPRAVTKAVLNTLLYHREHADELAKVPPLNQQVDAND